MAKGMELAINTLVVLILGVTLVAGGIALMHTIYTRAIEIPPEVSRQAEDQLFSMLLSSKQKIAVLRNVADVDRGASATFAVALQNDLEAVSSSFTILPVTLETNPPGIDCTSGCPEARALPGPYTLARFGQKAFYVVVDVPKETLPGEYSYRIVVEGKEEPSGTSETYARTTIVVKVR